MAIKLDQMTRAELEDLRIDIDKAIVELRKKEKKDALEAAQKAAAEFGFSLDELTGKKAPRAGGKTGSAEPKFMNPDNPTQTWTGKGRQPNWFKSAIDAGKNSDDMLI